MNLFILEALYKFLEFLWDSRNGKTYSPPPSPKIIVTYCISYHSGKTEVESDLISFISQLQFGSGTPTHAKIYLWKTKFDLVSRRR